MFYRLNWLFILVDQLNFVAENVVYNANLNFTF